jgi:glycosyltransferase involved in cell wall biosynthesis
MTTLNRGGFIRDTLSSILSQMPDECELVVLDAGSTDDTAQIVTDLGLNYPNLHYVQQESNNGVDRDYNRAVELATGEYCWLMTDDDIMKPGAIRVILEALRRDVSLVVVNSEAKDFSMTNTVQSRMLCIDTNRSYSPDEMDQLFMDVGNLFRYIGSVVIKRSVWLQREKERFYDSMFAHVGIIFQQALPSEAVVISTPLISYRMDNSHSFSSRAFETCFVGWPSLVWSLPLSDFAKASVTSAEPWRSLRELLLWRAFGLYTADEYRRILRPRLNSISSKFLWALTAKVPCPLANIAVNWYYSIIRPRYQGTWDANYLLHGLRNSPYSLRSLLSSRRS